MTKLVADLQFPLAGLLHPLHLALQVAPEEAGVQLLLLDVELDGSERRVERSVGRLAAEAQLQCIVSHARRAQVDAASDCFVSECRSSIVLAIQGPWDEPCRSDFAQPGTVQYLACPRLLKDADDLDRAAEWILGSDGYLLSQSARCREGSQGPDLFVMIASQRGQELP